MSETNPSARWRQRARKVARKPRPRCSPPSTSPLTPWPRRRAASAIPTSPPRPSDCGFAPTRDGRGRGAARNGIEAAIIASLAGNEAERLAGGDPGRPCSDVARWLTDGDPRDAEPYIEWLRLKAERTVEHPLRQRIILVIAETLLERASLTGQQIEELATHEVGRYMRGQ